VLRADLPEGLVLANIERVRQPDVALKGRRIGEGRSLVTKGFAIAIGWPVFGSTSEIVLTTSPVLTESSWGYRAVAAASAIISRRATTGWNDVLTVAAYLTEGRKCSIRFRDSTILSVGRSSQQEQNSAAGIGGGRRKGGE
jgi:hypothetical protein